jgi:hypothetical protein
MPREDGRQRGEVVVADERRLAPAPRPRAAPSRAEELGDADGGGGDADRRQREEQKRQVAPPADEQRHRQREDGVLPELAGRDQVRSPRVGAVAQERVEGRGSDQHEQPSRGQPDRNAATERREAAAQARRKRREPGGEHREVGQERVHLGRTGVEADPRLVVDVDEQRRKSEREDDRAERRQRARHGAPADARARQGSSRHGRPL